MRPSGAGDMIDISHFRLHERIYESETSIIFRSQRLADAQPVVVKLLKHDYVPPELAAWLRREYEITRNFQHTGIIKAYELLSEQHRWAIILEDFGGDSLHQLQLAVSCPCPISWIWRSRLPMRLGMSISSG
jgi:serine/threonine protein kinase